MVARQAQGFDGSFVYSSGEYGIFVITRPSVKYLLTGSGGCWANYQVPTQWWGS